MSGADLEVGAIKGSILGILRLRDLLEVIA